MKYWVCVSLGILRYVSNVSVFIVFAQNYMTYKLCAEVERF